MTLVSELAALLTGTDIGMLELRSPAGTLRLYRDRQPPSPAETPPCAPSVFTPVKACSPGVFRHRHPLHDRPLAQPGQAVRAGETVGLLQIGPLLIPVTTPGDGVVDALLVPDGALVGYGVTVAHLRPV